jgi:FtsP/CotA-like multicopper oxidase with cupredoxin domain
MSLLVEESTLTEILTKPRSTHQSITRRHALGLLGFGSIAVAGAGLFSLRELVTSNLAVSDPETREYFIGANEVEWDYAPSGMDLTTSDAFSDEANVFVEPGPNRIGHVYKKARYQAYTDASISTMAPSPKEWEHLGLLGPVIRATVGDTILVHFKNNTRFPASIHPHGVRYNKASEGAPYADGTTGSDKADDNVEPGATYTYTWHVPERSGPGAGDPSSIVWMYHSHSNEIADTYAGLVGPIIVTRREAARPDGSAQDINREFVTMFEVIDENASPYLDDNIAEHTSDPASVDKDDEDFGESNLMHSINGYVFGNLPGLSMRAGERVRWHVIGIGTEVDLHTPHWHGETLEWMGMRTDMVELLPMSMKTLDMVPDEPGTWLYHCHVNDHIAAGMSAMFTVTN